MKPGAMGRGEWVGSEWLAADLELGWAGDGGLTPCGRLLWGWKGTVCDSMGTEKLEVGRLAG